MKISSCTSQGGRMSVPYYVLKEGGSFVPSPEEPTEPKQEVDIIGKN